MALKKSQLYSSLWQSCDELRGGMDASQYKDYVLTLLFMKYVSDKAASARGSLSDGRQVTCSSDRVALKGDKEIGDRINKIIARLAEANELKGVSDQADFNDEGKLGSGKEMQDRLSKLVDKIYVHIDMDVLDPDEVPGHPLTVAGGPTSLQLGAALQEMFRYEKVSALGIASTPWGERDPDGVSRKAAYNLVAGAVRGSPSWRASATTPRWRRLSGTWTGSRERWPPSTPRRTPEPVSSCRASANGTSGRPRPC